MPLSRLENFLVNTDGNILYVNPSDLDATDSFDNKGNSLTRPFVTIQRALIEAARFTYQSGQNNDKFDRTTVLVYPGEHEIDNRPGLHIKDNGGSPQYFDQNGDPIAADIELDSGSIFDLNNVDNVLYKFNSVYGGAIVPKGTSIVGLDLRKTKIRPLYVPNPDVIDSVVPRSALFRVTGGCYFWQFSIFDANKSVYYSKTFTEKRNPNISHHKLTCFEYADGQNNDTLTGTTDLQQYYFKLMNAYGTSTGNRRIDNYPLLDGGGDFEPNTPETKIVGDLRSNDNKILELSSNILNASVFTQDAHGLTVDDQILITGVGTTDLYNGTYRVSGITSDRKFTYQLNSDAIDNVVTINESINPNARVRIEADTVTGASPYIFNCSLRSVFGMCGLHADGSKSTGFKSMVVAQFTGIGLQKDDNAFVIYNDATGDYLNSVNAAATGDPELSTPLYLNPKSQYRKRYDNFHIKVSNDAFIQAVSVFAIGFSNHFLAESGGEQSITNSNSNFGNKSLVSKGFKRDAFNRDNTGYVTHIVPPKDLEKTEKNIVWRSLDPLKTKSVGISSHLYIDGEKDITNPPTNIVNGFRIGAKSDDKLFLNVNLDGTLTTFSSPILMPVLSGDGPVAKKKFTVDRATVGNTIISKEFTLTENHNFLKGESVRVFSDDGRTPDGIEIGRKYFVIPGSADNKIKLANTVTDALADKPVPKSINKKGGVLTIESTVTDKIPGEIGHPIQYDTTENQWYILGSAGVTNTIFTGFNTGDNATTIADNNSSTYVLRKSETRALDDRIYRLRYVIPKDYTGADTAKPPEKNYVLQECKASVEENTITQVISNRNPKIIAGITTDSNNSTISIVTTEKAHKLSVGDKIRIKNVKSNTNQDPYVANPNSGYNGFFTVSTTPSSKTFTYTNTNTGFGTTESETADVVGIITTNRASGTSSALGRLPMFERTEYDTTYTVQEVDTIQDYISLQQDGVYYLTCLIGNISPTSSEFSELKYKQNSTNLYPTVDKDNPNNDPVQAVSAASNELLGKVDVNNPLNSLTKETAINYLRDNRVGFAITFAESNSIAGITTYSTDVEHNLNAITKLSVSVPGSGYGTNGQVRHNLSLVDEGGGSGDGATVHVTVGAGGTVAAVQIVDGGSAYTNPGITTLAIAGGTGGVVTIDAINNCVGNVMQVVGVGSITNRTDSTFNGLFRISSIPSTKQVAHQYYPSGQPQQNVTSAGIYTGPVSSTSGMLLLVNEVIGITDIVGVANTTLPGIITITTTANHHLSVGNKVKVADMTGSAATIYNGTDLVVKEIVASNKFTANAPIGISTSGGAIYKYALNSFGQDNSLASEKIAGSLSPLSTGIESIVQAGSGGISTSGTIQGTNIYPSSDIKLANTTGFKKGDFLQIENEIVRVVTVDPTNTTDLNIFRGVLGTQSVEHAENKLVRKINVVPSELHRFSAIRASGHTFEYIGYGPGNYSTSLPQKITKQIEPEQELLAISREEKGGIVFFSGMNDRGDFFSGQRAEPRELFLGDAGDSNSAIFDDLFVRNTLRVGGGPNQNLPSEFNGPVNFTNKITSTDAEDGIEAIKLLIKGNAIDKPSFQVGDDTSPSLIVNQSTQNVGINTINPNTNIELDVNGTIRANVYENFKLSDLPDATEETTYARNRIIIVNENGTGYKMIDPHELDSYQLRSMGISNDGTIYAGVGTDNASTPLTISGISTARFFVGERVKMFGVTKSGDNVTAPNPVISTPADTEKVKVEQIPSTGFSTVRTYYYWQAQYNLRNGKIGVSTQIDPDGNYSGSGARIGVLNTTLGSFNDLNHNALTLKRTDTDHGILIYRQIFTHPDGTAASVDAKKAATNANIEQAKLIAVLGQKELSNSLSDISWKDYGVYEQTAWSAKGTDNEFLGFTTSTTETHQIHFPVIAKDVGGRGWDIDIITEVGDGFIGVSSNYNVNGTVAGIGTTSIVKVVHDNSEALQSVITGIVSTGGNYLSLPSGTYLTNKLAIPTQFTLRGNGKNSIVKLQYYATDTTRIGTAGTAAFSLGSIDGNLVGSSVANPTDMTIENMTFDGNSSNNILFTTEADNNLLTFANGTSMLFKDMEIRNAGGGGLYARDSQRISIENSTIVDGGQTDRYNEFRPLDIQSSETVRINDCLFENYPGAVDVSVTSVVATGGNIIRNCGAGIDAYATGKITTSNNIILGPADEFIASPDIYDSDFDSINISINVNDTNDFFGPELLYIEDGNGKDISSSNVTVEAGIGTMVGIYSTTRTASLGSKFLKMEVLTQNSTGFNDRESGFLKLKLKQSEFGPLLPFVGTGASSHVPLGYNIIATEYMEKPPGFSTFVGITSGYWANNNQYVNIDSSDGNWNGVGVAVTQYIVKIEDTEQLTGISTGDVVKLTGHDFASSPSIAGGVSIGMTDQNNNVITAKQGLTVQRVIVPDRVVLTGFGVTALAHGSEPKVGDYISIRRTFTIAKGRVGVY